MFGALKELYLYRNMIISFTHSELRSRYKGSFLGIVWSLLNPLFLLCIYGLVFSFIIKGRIPNYPIYLFTGLLPWVFLRSSILGSATSITGNASLIKKTYFPREILPLATVLQNMLNFLFGLIVLFVALFLFSDGVSIHILWLPVIIIIQLFFSLAIALFLSAITVYLRDVRQILDHVVMGLFYLTPIIYDIDMFPSKYRWILLMNPITSIIQSYRDILLYHKHPSLSLLGTVFLLSCFLLFINWWIFRYLNRWFAEKV